MAKEQADLQPISTSSDHDALRCVVCERVITDAAFRAERGGSHEHTFVNPHGVTHHIGCFVAAPGCGYRGETQTAFSWFPGWSWQVGIFRCAGEQFHGLILAALRG